MTDLSQPATPTCPNKKETTLIQHNARQKASPRSVESLESDCRAIDSLLLQSRRARDTIRTQQIPQLMAAGDTDGVEEARREVARLDEHIADLAARREQTESAINAAQARDRAGYAAQHFRDIRKQIVAFKTDTYRLTDSLEAFAKALAQVRAQQDAMEAAMRGAGVAPSRDVFRSKLMGLVQLSLYVETDGALGEARTYDSIAQLRENGRANLRRAAAEAHDYFTRQAQGALGVSTGSPEVA